MSETGSLNLYGDELVATTGRHGSDIASQRIDALDRKCIEYALLLNGDANYALDIGCGLGIQGIRLALLGIETLLIDRLDINKTLDSLSRSLGITNIQLLLKDVRTLTTDDIPKQPNIVLSQRFIHYLDYQEAQAFLSTITKVMPARSRLFLSASGLYSELGEGYKDREKNVDERFCLLEPTVAKKHHIKEPVCLYSEADMKTLVEPFGMASVEIWSSSFGNIKAIFEKL